jgi:hypothetical protein
MIFSDRGWLRKISVVAAPALLFLLFLYLVLPGARKYYVRSSLDLKAVEKENVIVYAPDESTARNVKNTFTRFRTAFYDRFPLQLEPAGERVRIHVFENGEQLSDYYSQKTNDRLPHNSGYYDPKDHSIALEKVEQGVLEHAVKHEAVHHFLEQGKITSAPGLSPWLSEGLASLYQHYAITSASDGNSSWQLPSSAEQAILLPYAASVQLEQSLDAFLRVQGDDFQEEGNRAFYRQARLLVFFLVEEHSETFWKYVRYELSNGGDQVGAFRRIVGEPEQVQEELKQWVRQRIKKMEGEIR